MEKNRKHYLKLHDNTDGSEIFVQSEAVGLFGYDSENDAVYFVQSGMSKPILIKETLEDIHMLLNLAGHLVHA